MAFWKFWKKKDKKKQEQQTQEALKGLEEVDPEGLPKFIRDAVEKSEAQNKDRKLKHTLSISRSGRYKAKKRERQGLADKPDFYNSQTAGTVATSPGTQGNYSRTDDGHGSHGKNSTGNGSYGRTSCRELDQVIASHMGHSQSAMTGTVM